MNKNNVFNSFYFGIFRGLVIASLLFIILVSMYFLFPKQIKEYVLQINNSEQEVSIVGKFELLGKEGKKYNNENFIGKPYLVFFGFTSCPDICPYGLSIISDVLDYLEKDLNKFNAIFITLDPERDTYEKTSEFVENFHPNIIGLSGTKEKIEEAIVSWKVYRKKVELENSDLDYTIDHSTYIYLMDKRGKYFTHFSHTSDAQKIVSRIKELL